MEYATAYKPILLFFFKAVFVSFFPFIACSQCPTSQQLYEKIILIKNDKSLSDINRVEKFLTLKRSVDACHLLKDSVYALLLHRLGASSFSLNRYSDAISFTLASIRINTLGKKESNPKFAANSYYNLGRCFIKVNRYNDAMVYFDSCIQIGNRFKDSLTLFFATNARGQKTKFYNQKGDFQKVIEEADMGIQTVSIIHDSVAAVTLFNEQAWAYANLHRFPEAIANLNKSASFMAKNDAHGQADNYNAKAAISEVAGRYSEAMDCHKKAIAIRRKTNDIATLAGDYIDAGNTERKEVISKNGSDYSKAINYYTKALQLAKKSNSVEMKVKAMNNLAAIAFRKKNYADALTGYHNSLQQVVTNFKNPNALGYPVYRQCNAISDKNFLSLLLANKAECLLYLYKETTKKEYLNASLRTALLTDSIITDMRHEQTGEQSKLYWRTETREFFTNAIEACYQANDVNLAFYFMEKSRAVLLNDKLNELGAAAHLPPAEAGEEQRLQINVLAKQQQLAKLDGGDPAYKEEQLKLFAAKETLNSYIETLQNKFPVYYQYKYADVVPGIGELQKYLGANKQSFIQYFIEDTTIYILAITSSTSTFLKQTRKDINGELFTFLKTCSNVQLLNNEYGSFASQANNLYQLLFKPTAVPKGRVIICSDAVMIPFEALTTDVEGRDFLINNYAFSYVYSARFLLKKFSNPPGKGNFLGVAPVSYAAYLGLQSLTQSGATLTKSASNYGATKLLMNGEANTKNFLLQLPRYTIAAVFSHARADSTDKEPVLFMSDSMIRLSELQLIQNPSTQLIVLSACQTNAGKLAAGEGVFSLARGFASAGIPSIAATLWKADEDAIYAITKIFLQNIAKGICKDDALQAAKLSFIQNGSNKNRLPYYWANMIVAGNAEPVILSKNNSKTWLIGGLSLLVAVTFVIVIVRKKKN